MSSAATLRWEVTDPDQLALARSARDALAGDAASVAVGADLGWHGIGVPEKLGGYGGSFADLAQVAEEVGAALGATDSVWTAAVAGQVLATAPSPPVDVIGRLVAGHPLAIGMVGRRPAEANRDVLSTEVLALGSPDGLLVVPILGADGPAVLVTDTTTAGVAAHPVGSVDPSRPLSRFMLTDVDLSATLTVPHPGAEQAWATAVGTVAALDAVGTARTPLTRTLDYSRTREQFGRPIGSFQAYKHRCASAFVELRLAQALAFAAAERESAELSQRAARHCTSAALHICSEAILLHGGIGFTAEANLHAHLGRARLDEAIACRGSELDQMIVAATTTRS